MKINHVAVYSEDFPRTLQFYNAVFPYCSIEKDENDVKAPVAISLSSDCWVALFEGKKNIFEHIAFEVSVNDFSAILQRLELYRTKYIREKHKFPHVCESLYFESPDGYEIEIFCKELG